MSCRDQARLLDAYVDGELGLEASLALEDHLHSCANCRATLGRMKALRASLRRNVDLEAAHGSLRASLQSALAIPLQRSGLSWRWGLAFTAPGVTALALSLWLAFFAAQPAPVASSTHATRVVYHVSSSATARDALRNLVNHLNASPNVKIVVVAHNDGVDFLLRGARDPSGEPYEPAVSRIFDRGVEFRVCYNTLERREIGAGQVLPAAVLVPSGIAEIGRLQSQEGYSYMRL